MIPIRTTDANDRHDRGDSENAEGRGHADKLRHQGEPVDQNEVEQRKPAPE